MPGKGCAQTTLSRYFTKKNASSHLVKTNDLSFSRKNKVTKSEPNKPSKRPHSFNDENPQNIKRIATNNDAPSDFKSKKCGIFPCGVTKMDSFRFKYDVSKDEINDSPPRSEEVKKGKGFQVSKGIKLTPLEEQVVAIKEKYLDTVLFVECGYKYRFFGEDAEIASKELDIIAHLDHNFKTASIPTHRLHIHIRRLVAKGYKVGVVKQMETAATKAMSASKTTPFSRELAALYTKATLIGEDVAPIGSLLEEVTHYSTSSLMVLMETEPTDTKLDIVDIVLISLQPTTGDFVYDSFGDTMSRSALWSRLEKIHPVEVIVSHSLSEVTKKSLSALLIRHDDNVRIETVPDSIFEFSSALHSLCQLYDGDESRIRVVSTLPCPVICCLGATLHYLKRFKLEKILKNASHIAKLNSLNDYMTLPGSTLHNLEIVVNNHNQTEKGSLFWLLNHTSTKFGARVLRHWLLHPMVNLENILERQTMIEELIASDATTIPTLKSILQNLPDFEKSITTILYKKCSPCEFWDTVSGLSYIQQQFASAFEGNIEDVIYTPSLLQLFRTVIKNLLTVHEFSENIDVKSARENKKTSLLKDWSEFTSVIECNQKIKNIELQLEEMKTNIAKTLGTTSFKYTTVSGIEYLIEVKSNNLKAVPSTWHKINLTKTCTRFRSEEGQKLFTNLQQLREQLLVECHRAWLTVLERFSDHYQDYREAIKCIGSLDALCSLAKLAQSNGYCKPEIVDSENNCIIINAGRHPMIHYLRGNDQFVANNTNLESIEQKVMLVTGPNMGGKSCYVKQVAIIVLMAQVGSYVPAESAKLSVFDAIYTRMGATDEIFSGKSSLLMEISETSEIMQHATKKSLVILDELGRGTSTHDGVAIAASSLDFFLNKIQCLTIFVTHYLTLCGFEQLYPKNVGNHHMAFIVNEEAKCDDLEAITFLYQLKSGHSAHSYGLNVARLANIPISILQMAQKMSSSLQQRVIRQKCS